MYAQKSCGRSNQTCHVLSCNRAQSAASLNIGSTLHSCTPGTAPSTFDINNWKSRVDTILHNRGQKMVKSTASRAVSVGTVRASWLTLSSPQSTVEICDWRIRRGLSVDISVE